MLRLSSVCVPKQNECPPSGLAYEWRLLLCDASRLWCARARLFVDPHQIEESRVCHIHEIQAADAYDSLQIGVGVSRGQDRSIQQGDPFGFRFRRLRTVYTNLPFLFANPLPPTRVLTILYHIDIALGSTFLLGIVFLFVSVFVGAVREAHNQTRRCTDWLSQVGNQPQALRNHPPPPGIQHIKYAICIGDEPNGRRRAHNSHRPCWYC